jgi:hypothetical protein
MQRITAILAGALLLALASPGLAQNPTTDLRGDVDIYVSSYDVDTLAKGTNAFAFTSAGTIHDRTLVKGDVDLDVRTDDIWTKADGGNARACAFLGSVGASTYCGPKQFVWLMK